MGSSSYTAFHNKKGLSTGGVATRCTTSPKNNDDSKGSTSLDHTYTKLAVISEKSWTTKQKKAYQKILSGIKKATILGKDIRFMTLTSSEIASERDLNRDFERLKKRIRRRYGIFEYFKVRTNEGNGVMHILFRGSYISQKWLSKTWEEIHQSKIVDIRMMGKKWKRLARYLVSQYIAGQTFIRNSWSWGWVFRGFVGVWEALCEKCRGQPLEKILKEWEKKIYEHCYKQKSIYEYLSDSPPPPLSWADKLGGSVNLTAGI